MGHALIIEEELFNAEGAERIRGGRREMIAAGGAARLVLSLKL